MLGFKSERKPKAAGEFCGLAPSCVPYKIDKCALIACAMIACPPETKAEPIPKKPDECCQGYKCVP